MEDIAEAIDNGDDVDIIYLDFAKHLTGCRILVSCLNYMDRELGAVYMTGSRNFLVTEFKG